MVDYFKAGIIVSEGQSDSNRIREIVHGSTTFAIPSIGADGAVGSASGIAPGMVAGMKVIVMPYARPSGQQVIIAAAIGTDGGVQLTATNASASAIAGFNSSANYFGWR